MTLLKINKFVLLYLLTSKKDFLTKIKNRQLEPFLSGDSWFLRSKHVKYIFLRIYISRQLCTFSNQPHATTNILSSLDHLDTIKVEEICETRFQLFLSCSNSLGDTFIWLVQLNSTPFENAQRWMGRNTFPILLLNDDNMIGEH